MLKALLKDSAIYGIGGILARAISVLLLPFYTRVLEPAEYGVLDLLMVFGAIVNVSIALEISQGLSRYLPEAESEAERASWASTALWFTVAAFGVFVAICIAFGSVFARLLLDSSSLRSVFILGVLSASINALYYLGQTQLRWMRMAKRSAIANLVFMLISIGSTIVYVLILRLGVHGVLYGQITGFAAGTALTVAFARANYRLTFSWEKCRQMLKFSLPFVPSSVALFAATYVDRIAIKELLTLEDVGVYGVAYRLASPMLLVMGGFQAALTPLLMAHHKEAGTPANLARIFRFFVAAALLASVVISVFAREIVSLLVAPEYAGAAMIFPLLAPAMLLPQMKIFAPGLFLAKRTTPMALLSVLAAVAAIVLNFLLIPILGTAGSALANLIAAAVVFVIFMALSQKHYAVPHRWRPIGFAVACSAVIVVFAFLVPVLAVHAFLAALAVVTIPMIVLGQEELRLLGGKAASMLSRS